MGMSHSKGFLLADVAPPVLELLHPSVSDKIFIASLGASAVDPLFGHAAYALEGHMIPEIVHRWPACEVTNPVIPDPFRGLEYQMVPINTKYL